MKKFFIIFFAIFFAVPSVVFSADGNSGTKVDDKYVERLENSIKKLGQELSMTKDPETKVKIVRRMNTLYQAYYHPDVRLHFIRKKYPKYAAMIVRTRNMTEAERERGMKRDISRRRTISEAKTFQGEAKSPWPLLSDKEKAKLCIKASDKCLERSDIRFCRFVLSRCKGIIDEELYQKVKYEVPN